MHMLDAFDLAVILVDAALTFLPADEKILQLAAPIRVCHAAYKEHAVLQNDAAIPAAHKNVLALFLLMATATDCEDYFSAGAMESMPGSTPKDYEDPRVSETVKRAELASRASGIRNLGNQQFAAAKLAEWLRTQPNSNMLPSITRAQQRYPNVFKCIAPLYQKLSTQMSKKTPLCPQQAVAEAVFHRWKTTSNAPESVAFYNNICTVYNNICCDSQNNC